MSLDKNILGVGKHGEWFTDVGFFELISIYNDDGFSIICNFFPFASGTNYQVFAGLWMLPIEKEGPSSMPTTSCLLYPVPSLPYLLRI